MARGQNTKPGQSVAALPATNAGDEGGIYVVRAGNPDFNGKMSGVQFEGGVAGVQDEALARQLCAEWGFEIVSEPPPAEDAGDILPTE